MSDDFDWFGSDIADIRLSVTDSGPLLKTLHLLLQISALTSYIHTLIRNLKKLIRINTFQMLFEVAFFQRLRARIIISLTGVGQNKLKN